MPAERSWNFSEFVAGGGKLSLRGKKAADGLPLDFGTLAPQASVAARTMNAQAEAAGGRNEYVTTPHRA